MIPEPEINPLEDTHPTQTVKQVELRPSPWQSFMGIGLLIGSFVFTLIAIVLMIAPVTPNIREIAVTYTPMATDTDSQTGQQGIPTDTILTPVFRSDLPVILPTINPEQQAALLTVPITNLNPPSDLSVTRNMLAPFTIIPNRARNQVITYTIQKGDTIYDIAQRFGLTQETIGWSNDRRSIWTLQPGDTLNIPPTDGVYHQAVGEATLREIAAQYQVDDPYTMIDSEANQLAGFTPEMTPPSGTWIFVPGGQAEEINWAPQIEVVQGGTSGGGAGGNLVSFQPGDPGSCRPQPPGTGGGWGRPMAIGTYTVTRGFSSWHPGIDLAAPIGTSVYAANSGTVIFAGRNNWGYGNAIVISHGPFATLYGHLNSVNVSCGQTVGTGQIIGTVGNTGNSSGPHLHFEIMYNGIRGNPQSTISF
ncbi:MAG: M23 family metallopeptidase [Anaerolineae bacterium]|nr:M23 family metallopeptidase [Anaerolineae bacterium]